MPADERTARINTAVDAILEYCVENGAHALEECVNDLINDKSWSAEDIQIVRDAVQRRLDELEAGQ